jgi:hypothetical protein
MLDRSGTRKKRVRKLPQSQWSVLIQNHHEGFIDWSTYEANRIRSKYPPAEPGALKCEPLEAAVWGR